MSWRKFSRILWPLTASFTGAVFAGGVYLATAHALLRDWRPDFSRTPTVVAIVIGVLPILGFPLVVACGAFVACKAVTGWFEPIESLRIRR